MSGYKETFERKEVKYLLGWKQYEALRRRLSPYVEEDAYGKTQILNIYFDTPDFRLVRRSLEKPSTSTHRISGWCAARWKNRLIRKN